MKMKIDIQKFGGRGASSSYQGKEYDKAPSTGKTADVIIKEVRKWQKENRNSVIIENNKKAIDLLEKIENNPNAEITIYRATPGNSINNNDWVFLDKDYAERWTRTPMGTPKPGFKVVELKTKAKNVEWTGKNLEFAYRKKVRRTI